MVLWPVDEVFTADTTAPPPTADTVSSAVASASSAIATASSAIATASTAIATASSAIATASSAIATDQSAASVDAIDCDDDTTDLCDTATSTTSAETSAATSTIAGDDCSTVTSSMRLGHIDTTVQQVDDDDRGGTGRGLDIVGPSRLADRFNRFDFRPRTVGLKMTEKVILTALTMFFEKLELALYMSLYKLKLIYTMIIAPVLGL
ncbi:unnamed protein product [Macrosiphum euphorbiae]|uniref:Uncharacterized protein n=1 Tax=Macrosiphum euphorbiae TaxID=13131 RepID=A0AAV0WLJ5_9HEMI|nr:unnamed protein product [Macrosiphum euphorbiae]